MKRPALVLPLAAVLAAGGFLLASHLPHAQARHRAGSARMPASDTSCARRRPAVPFIGAAVNPPIARHARSFATATGVRPAVVEFYDAFGRPFQQHEASQAAAMGAIPLIQLNPRHVSLAAIAAGRHDAYLRKYAAAVRRFACQVALSFGHEMNGSWYPWGRPRTSPAIFIAAWRHIHGVFAAAHARNVIWSWDPDHGGSSAREWWPGRAYVDWVGVDGYQRPGQTFASTFASQLADIRSFTSRPVFIAETAVAPGPSQRRQISGLFTAVSKYRLSGLIWFDLNRKEPWQLEGHPGRLAAFRKAAATMKPGA